MKTQILLALDGSEPSMNAARYVANLLKERHGVSVTLFHVFGPGSPSMLKGGGLWISVDVKNELDRRKVTLDMVEDAIESEIFQPAREIYLQAGFRDEQIQAKCAIPHDESDVAHEILKTCEEGNYDTIVMGKRGLSRVRTFLTGSVTEKVVRHGTGHAVWVIE